MADIINPYAVTDDDDLENSGGIINPYAKPKATPEVIKDELIPTITIDPQMYDNFETMDQANRYFREILDDPDVATPNGLTAADIVAEGNDPTRPEYIFYYTNPNTNRRQKVLTPDRNRFGFGSKPTVGVGQVLRGGIAESVSDAAEFGGAVSDKYFGTDVQETIAAGGERIDTPQLTDALIADGLPALGAGLTPAGMAFRGTQILAKLTSNAPKIVQWAVTAVRSTLAAVAGETAATGTVGTDEGNFIFSEDGFFNNMAEMGDTEADALLEQRLNTFTEGLIAGGVLGTGLKLTGTVLRLGNDTLIAPFLRMARGKEGLEQAVYEQLSRELARLDTTVDEGTLRKARIRLAEIVKENKDLLIADFANLEEVKKITLDTVGALGRSDAVDSRTLANAQKVRAGEINSGGGEIIKDAVDRPSIEVQGGLAQETDMLLDGATPNAVMQDASDVAVDVARTQVDEAAGGVAAARKTFETSAAETVTTLKGDPGFTELLARLEKVTGTEIVDPKTAAFSDIVRGLEDSLALMVNEKNAKYAPITGGAVDADSILELFMRMPEEDITAAARNFSRTDPVSSFLEQLKAQKVPEEITDAKGNVKTVNRDETPEEIEVRFKDWVAANTDFGFFYNRIRPELSQLASDAYNKPGGANLGRYYRSLVKFIDEDMVKFVGKSDPELEDLATEAQRYYKEQFAPIWRDNDAMEQFSVIYASTLGRTPANNLASTVTRSEPFRPGFDAQAESFTRGVLEGGNTARTVNLATALEGTTDPARIADYFILDTVNGFANAIKTQGMDNVDYSSFAQKLMQYAEQLNGLAKTSPEMASKVASINAFISRLEGVGGDQAQLQTILEGAQRASAGLMADVETSVLKNFFDKGKTPAISKLLDGSQIKGTSNPQAAFETIFGAGQKLGGESRNRVQELMEIMSGQPEAEQVVLLRGLKTAYNKFLDNKLIATAKETGGTRPVNVKAIEEGVEGRSSILDIGDQIYADKPQFMEAIRATLDAAAEATQSLRATPIRGQSATSYNREAATATTRFIYTFIGPLSRPGSRIRAVMGAIIEKTDPDQRAAALRKQMLADSDYFLEMAARYNKNPGDPLMEDLLINYISSAIIKANASEDDDGSDGLLNKMEDTVKNITEVPLTIIK